MTSTQTKKIVYVTKKPKKVVYVTKKPKIIIRVTPKKTDFINPRDVA